ncbi:anaerobic ribonucleoside-triphosphate reductase activating protein [Exiguobacterium flavidum]|uniref:anaerobic ribonucleoside-triphosphate reductase activating protein n=1 Tax=Exiguobacterium flavidum TaxID=2184695 RepID=UPI000DF72B33|nr:anaerobic ribonucleoside-triphosphate reductase activating protein [Exiguobacterium flavidum]
MRLLSLVPDSVVDGPGLRSVLFFAGCPHRCDGCHNPASWNARGGTEWEMSEVLDWIKTSGHRKLTISGGEPFLQADALAELTDILAREGYDIWVYTGYTLEALRQMPSDSVKRILNTIDALVDGPFVLAERTLSLPYRGSTNQRIIAKVDLQQKG